MANTPHETHTRLEVLQHDVQDHSRPPPSSSDAPSRIRGNNEVMGCWVCKHSITWRYFRTHLTESHWLVNRFFCSTCNKLKTRKNKLKKHCKEKHGQVLSEADVDKAEKGRGAPKALCCGFCGRHYMSSSDIISEFISHVRMHYQSNRTVDEWSYKLSLSGLLRHVPGWPQLGYISQDDINTLSEDILKVVIDNMEYFEVPKALEISAFLAIVKKAQTMPQPDQVLYPNGYAGVSTYHDLDPLGSMPAEGQSSNTTGQSSGGYLASTLDNSHYNQDMSNNTFSTDFGHNNAIEGLEGLEDDMSV